MSGPCRFVTGASRCEGAAGEHVGGRAGGSFGSQGAPREAGLQVDVGFFECMPELCALSCTAPVLKHRLGRPERVRCCREAVVHEVNMTGASAGSRWLV
jgi:hypothetical protein